MPNHAVSESENQSKSVTQKVDSSVTRVFSITQRHAEEDEWRQNPVNGGLRELDPIEKQIFLPGKVKLGKFERHSLVHVFVKGAQGEHRHRGVDHVVHGHEERLKDGLNKFKGEGWPVSSVTRVGEISPLWHYFKSFGQIFEGLFSYLAKYLILLCQNVMLLGKFSLL